MNATPTWISLIVGLFLLMMLLAVIGAGCVGLIRLLSNPRHEAGTGHRSLLPWLLVPLGLVGGLCLLMFVGYFLVSAPQEVTTGSMSSAHAHPAEVIQMAPVQPITNSRPVTTTPDISVLGLMIIGVICCLGVFAFVRSRRRHQTDGHRSPSPGMILTSVLILGIFLAGFISLRFLPLHTSNSVISAQAYPTPIVQDAQLSQPIYTQQVLSQNSSASSLPTGSQARLKAGIFALGLLALIGGAICFAGYVFFVSRRPAAGTPFRPQSMFWLLPVVGMWGLTGWFFAEGVLNSQGYTNPTPEPVTNLLLEHGGFEEADVLAFYEKNDKQRLSEKAEEIEGAPGAYPQWIYEAQEWAENTDQYLSPATFVLMGTGSTEKEAVNRAMEQASPKTIQFFQREHQTNSGSKQIPAKYLEKTMTHLYAIKGTVHTEPGDSFEMYRVWVRVFVETDSKSEAYRYWKASLIERRASLILSFVGFLVFSFMALTTYLRLNNRSERRFQNRLRFATLIVLIPVGLIVCGFLVKLS